MKKIKLTKFHALLFLSFIFNTYIFLINYFNYDSTRGTDYNKYGPYLDFYTFGLDRPLQEQGVGYFWFISYISKLKINSLKISPNFESLVHNFGIQIGNYIFFVIGCIVKLIFFTPKFKNSISSFFLSYISYNKFTL